MATRDLSVGLIFLIQTVVGTLGNLSLLYHYLHLSFTGCRARSIDLILRHLTVANALVILSKEVSHMMADFGVRQCSDDFRCDLLFYVQRVARGVSIESTCLLSIFQAVMISPQNSRWAALKGTAPKYIGPSTALCWILNMLINTIYLLYETGQWISINTWKTSYGFCCVVIYDNIRASLFAVWLSFTDVCSLGLVLWASGYMVFILHRHKQRVRYIHATNVSPRSSAGSRATRSILVLVSTFVFCNTASSICQVCVAFFNNPSQSLVTMSALLAVCFPTLSPFVLMNCDPSVSRPSFA
ncbi:vomeronasal type-1 receptor 4-like [Hyaena hyaena]|uniref:vomeronasal type-1 receptor 4-like n=1 Tax=Hyaena hyaena TaxID=95912 RepID=UPI001923E99F|nr:vomeronasal type-1 receptor 4-like [Hyaena hyaena]